ncbi:metallophosphoesterase family protein [Abyssalbus ytuae]|uniref:Metallophosphoesterase n=1 Tax=Abyssalbus ytuae TaxID=2926907 RepID=A0A9E7CU84_9FLAO|nr:metallophosphoesterase [Abyssalbus ytuae]UOB17907.1 metallophosphoesterase [Abyssalbus ytuae]
MVFILSCKKKQGDNPEQNIQIAFLADVHLQDVYAHFSGDSFKGILNAGNNTYTTIRTMDAQLHSTRIFNENYFAFLAALNDIAKRKIKYVVLPGDFSDDGQPVHVKALKKILNDYADKYSIQFFITTGNHDPVKPYKSEGVKADYLGEGGRPQPVMSTKALYKTNNNKHEHSLVIVKEISQMGYDGITDFLQDFGFFPQKEYLYWETPFSSYNSHNYSYEQAFKEAGLEKRSYAINPVGNTVPDASYLVEPVKDLWLLAIDANVYVPKENNPNNNDPGNYNGAALGYKNVPLYKKHLIDWVEDVAKRAKKEGKILVAFSHYPMVEFHDNASTYLKKLFGKDRMQLERVPQDEIARIFADIGLKIHFAGHMHINDTGVKKTENGNTLVNVQVPTLAAYMPAYKLLTIKENALLEIETVPIDSVPDFKSFFPLYEKEYDFLKSVNKEMAWDTEILNSKTYHEFTNKHLKELVRLRFLKNDWPVNFRNFILNMNGENLLAFSISEKNFSYDDVLTTQFKDSLYTETNLEILKPLLLNNKLSTNDLREWTGFDLIFDFYRLKNADKLALNDIGEYRLQQYKLIARNLIDKHESDDQNSDGLNEDMYNFFKTFEAFTQGQPAVHFSVNLNTGEVKDMK